MNGKKTVRPRMSGEPVFEDINGRVMWAGLTGPIPCKMSFHFEQNQLKFKIHANNENTENFVNKNAQDSFVPALRRINSMDTVLRIDNYVGKSGFQLTIMRGTLTDCTVDATHIFFEPDTEFQKFMQDIKELITPAKQQIYQPQLNLCSYCLEERGL